MELLAVKARPTSINQVIGQKHLIGKDKAITNLVKNKKLFSMILYGNPGIGKTTIAMALVNDLNLKYKSLNAVVDNKKEFEIAFLEAKMNNGLILIVDEIHRLNKDKQDLLLPYLESGLITLIGLTTSNPYHAINKAIRSRCQIFELHDLTEKDLKEGIKNIIKNNYLDKLTIDPKAINYIISLASSDLRYAYNLIEMAYYTTKDHHITLDVVQNIANKPNIFADKDDSEYYDTISAFQKSIRGSDVNASLYYLAKLIIAGDLDIIIRRLSVIAYEDIGLANPMIGVKLDSAINAALRVGFPEARIPLSSIVIEMALSPKSNAALLALDAAMNDLQSGNNYKVPNHITNHSNEYLYPHNYPHHYVKQQYLPKELQNRKYYVPQENINEIKLKDIYDKISN